MRHRGNRRHPDEDEESDSGEEEPPTAVPRRRRHPTGQSSGPVRKLRAWREDPSEEGEPNPDEEEAEVGWRRFLHRERRPVFFRARDSWYFEPLLALAIIVLVLVSLWAYTQNWPPVFVVESSSMQHGGTDRVGLLNTGDLILIQKTDGNRIVPYVDGSQTGYVTYGEFGDVLLYNPDGNTATTPIIHRAIVYLEWNPADSTYSAPALAGFGNACGAAPDPMYSVTSTTNGCGWSHLSGTLSLFRVGWQNATVEITLTALGGHSGFVTMGDNNYFPGFPAQGQTDQVLGFSSLVQAGWIVGVARGMVPWFGSLKLLLEGNAAAVPTQSWQFLSLTIVGLILGGFGIHYTFRTEGWEDPRRKAAEEAETETEAEEAPDDSDEEDDSDRPTRTRGLRAWLARRGDDEEEAGEATDRARLRSHRRRWAATGRGGKGRGRPHPKVRRGNGSRRSHSARSKDEEP